MRCVFLLAVVVGTVAHAAAPSGWWITGPEAEYFRAELDTTVKHSGRSSARFSSVANQGLPLGFLCQRLNISAFAGSRVRVSAWVKTKAADAAGLLLRLHQSARLTAQDHLQGPQLEKDSDWTLLALVFDVPKEHTALTYGLWLKGKGTAWLDDVKIERVPTNVPVTVSGLRAEAPAGNLDAEGEGPAPWFVTGSAQADYALQPVSDVVHGGKRALHLFPKTAVPPGYGVALQHVSPKPWLGKRLRISAFIQTDNVVARGDFWARAQGADSPPDGPGLSWATTALRPTSAWARYELVLDIPLTAVALQFGAGIQGPGRLWIDDVTIETVSLTTPLAPELPTTPRNASFEDL
jgi:hypothetical protein